MIFQDWLNTYVNSVVSNAATIIPLLSQLYTLEVYNESNTSNVDISESIHLYKKGKVCSHLLIENGRLWIAKSRIAKGNRYAAAQTLNEVIKGDILKKSSITNNVNCIAIDINNVTDFVDRVMAM